MKVLIIPEDVPNDQHILKPLFERLLASMGRRAKVRVSQERLRGVDQALNAERIAEIVDRYRGEVRVIVLCVDRDGEVDRRLRLANIEREIERVRLFFVEYFSPISRAFLTTDEPSPVRFRGDGFRPAAHLTVHPPSLGAPRRLATPLVLDSA